LKRRYRPPRTFGFYLGNTPLVLIPFALPENDKERATAFVGGCIEGDHRYQPAEWLNWLELRNNTVGVNGLEALGTISNSGIQSLVRATLQRQTRSTMGLSR
jgi:hypothetical protein